MATRMVSTASPRFAPKPTATHVMPGSRGFGGRAACAAVATTPATLARRIRITGLGFNLLLFALAGGNGRGGIQLRLAPERNVLGMRVGRSQAQLQEVERGTEARMRQQAQHTFALALREALLEQPDFLHRQGEAA